VLERQTIIVPGKKKPSVEVVLTDGRLYLWASRKNGKPPALVLDPLFREIRARFPIDPGTLEIFEVREDGGDSELTCERWDIAFGPGVPHLGGIGRRRPCPEAIAEEYSRQPTSAFQRAVHRFARLRSLAPRLNL
jgi:hypothetical protein